MLEGFAIMLHTYGIVLLIMKTPDSAAFIALNVSSNPFYPFTPLILMSYSLLCFVNDNCSLRSGSPFCIQLKENTGVL